MSAGETIIMLLSRVAVVTLATVGLTVAAHAQPPASTPRTAWGDPDLRGLWNHGTATPLERPTRFAGRDRLTTEEIAETNAAARSTDGVGARRAVWWERGLSDGRTALIVDPEDGRIPYRPTPRPGSRPEPHRAGPEGLNLGARCLSQGIPRLGGPYSQNIHLLQTPDHVVLLHEMIHEIRVIPLDRRRERPSPGVRQWLGNARGRWEDDTLVVETGGFRPDQVFRGFSMRDTRLTERFALSDAHTILYTVTFDDPGLWSAPWSAQLSMPRTEGPMFEFACHEGNYGMTAILETARGEERDTEPPTRR